MSNLWKALRDVSRDVDPTVGFEPGGQGLHGDDEALVSPPQEPATAAPAPASDESSALARRLTNPARPPQPKGVSGRDANAGEAPPVLSKLGQALNATARPVPNGYASRPRPNPGVDQAAGPGPTAGRGRMPQDPAAARRLISSLSAATDGPTAAPSASPKIPSPTATGPTNARPNAGPTNARPNPSLKDPGPTNAGPTNAGPTNAGPTNARPNAGPTNAGTTNAGPTAIPTQAPTARSGSGRATQGPGSGPSLLASRRALHDASAGPDRLTEDPGAAPGLAAGRRTTMEPPAGTPASFPSNGPRPAQHDAGLQAGAAPTQWPATGAPVSAARSNGGSGTQGTTGPFSPASDLPSALRAFAPGTPDVQYDVGAIVGAPQWHPGDDDVMPSDGRKAPRQRLRERFGL
jgi:hypothetical protein